MDRPIMNMSIEELERYYNQNKNDPKGLTVLHNELKYRNTRRANALKLKLDRDIEDLIQAILGSIQSHSNRLMTNTEKSQENFDYGLTTNSDNGENNTSHMKSIDKNQVNIYKKYQERLVNLSGRNRSLVINTLHKKRAFDLVHFASHLPQCFDKIVNTFVFGNASSIELMPDPMQIEKTVSLQVRDVWHSYNTTKSRTLEDVVESLKPLLGQWTLPVNDAKGIAHTDKQLQSLTANRLKEYIQELNSMSHSLRTLYREIEAERKENGLYNLKIAIHFAEGKFADGSKCRAPLSFLPVELSIKNNSWFLKKSNEGDIIANDVFILAASKYNQTRVTKDNLEINQLKTLVTDLITFYEDLGVTIKSSPLAMRSKYSVFIPFTKYTSKHYDLMSEGQLFYKPFLVMGDFPLSNAIFEDYRALIDQDLTSPTIETLLGKASGGSEGSLENKQNNSEREFYYINDLDYSQELAILSSLRSNNLVIFGPPGTGKSQTITNLIADKLAKGKRVLMVSQKKAALDVIFNRLSTIQDKVLLIHDANTGKKEFYEKNLRIFEYFEDNYNLSQIRGQKTFSLSNQLNVLKLLNTCSDRIDNEVRSLSELYEFLYTPTHDRYTGQDLMLFACSTISPEQVEFNKIRKLVKEYKADELNKDLIQTLFAKQAKVKSASTFYELRQLSDDYPVLKELNKEFTEYDAFDAVDKLERMQQAFEDYIETITNKGLEDMNRLFNSLGQEELVNKEVLNKVEDAHGHLKLPVAQGFSRLIKMLFQRKQLLHIEAENTKEFQRILSGELESFSLLSERRTELGQCIDDLITYFNDKFIDTLKIEAYESRLNLTPGIFSEAHVKLNRFRDLYNEHHQLSSPEKNLVEKLVNSFNSSETSQEMLLKFESFYCAIRLIELNTTQLFKQFESVILSHKSIVDEIQDEILQKREWTKAYIKLRWDRDFLLSAKEKSPSELKRISGLKRKVRSIREAFSNHYNHLVTMYPCILLGPEMVSSVLPLVNGMFDVVVFDEASQLYVEEAIPSLFRGKSVVVAGDDKQLKPNSAFKSRLINDEWVDDNLDVEDTDDDFMIEAALEEESLLDLAKVTYYPTNLMFHYRSEYEELINFSNHAFYSGRLRTVPNQHDMSSNPPIKRILVTNGSWLNRQNVEEAIQVVNLIKKILLERTGNETVGVITFNVSQKDLIQDLLEIEANRDSVFNDLLLQEANRVNDNEDVSLFVKNIENVQGDERDLIIFSTGYAKNEQGRLVANFGSLSQDGGENRLNVAISRAKKQIYVVTSFEPEDLKVDLSKNLGPKLLKNYLEYIRLVSNGDLIQANLFLQTLGSRVTEPEAVRFDSEFEIEVYEALCEMGYTVKTQVGTSGYKIDLVIYDESTSRHVLGIECDGASYHSSRSAKESDVYRQKFLESRGWKIYRIWSRNWWKNKKDVLKELKLIIDTELNKKVKYSSIIDITETVTVRESVQVPIDTLPQVPKPDYVPVSSIVGFGDRVLVQDAEGEEYEVYLESNPLNKNLMNPFQLIVMGKALNEKFLFNGQKYEIVLIESIN